MPLSRREFLTAAGATAAGAWPRFDVHDLIAAAAHAQHARTFAVLSAADAADLEAAAAQIMPSDGTPGAREARVIYFIDRSLATFAKDQRDLFKNGAKELRSRAAKMQRGATSFAALPDAQQHAVITSLQKDQHEFFRPLRVATMAGMFANPEYGGNYGKAGWKLIGFDDRFSWQAPFGWYDRNG